MPTVLALGLDPAFIKLAGSPPPAPELIRAFIESQLERLRVAGYDVVPCLVDLGATAEAVTEQCLKFHNFDCVVFGAGLHAPERLLLFEKLLNLTHTHAHRAKLCFNTSPSDTLEAVQRWVRA